MKVQNIHPIAKLKAALLLVPLCLVAVLPLQAQSAFEYISRNRQLSASNYCIYPDSMLRSQTPPPAGKRPFYISHYGRHGSRYLSNRKGYEIPYEMLRRADSLQMLTPLGRDAMREMAEIIADTEGRWGDLSGLGKRQQQNIAERMMQNFPEVFRGEAFVDARSTIVNRCILSMGSAVLKMVSLNSRLKVSMRSSYQDMWYLNHQDKHLRDTMMNAEAKKAFDHFSENRKRNPRLMELLFTDTAYVRQHVDEPSLNYYLLKAALIQQNTKSGQHRRFLLDLFSLEDIHQFWQRENAWWYVNYGPSLYNAGHLPYTQRFLLRQIIHTADSIISTPSHGATLRYGHETIVLPLTCLMGINGFDYETYDLESLERSGWWACLVFPMASNIQLVFYRESPADHDVLVKVLLNEQEASLPIPTDIAPYYHWRDFRDYYLRKIDSYEAGRDK